MAKNRKTPDMNLPVWFDGQNINEALFCEEFLHERRIIFANGAFFTPDGRVTDDLPLRGEIYDKLKFCAVNNIPRKITNILEVLKLEAQVPDFPPEQDRIHLSNGTLLLNGTFTEGRPAIVRSRLPVAYNPDAMVVCAIGMFFTLLTDSPIAIVLQFLWWMVDKGATGLSGDTKLTTLMIRHNTLRGYETIQEGLQIICMNRLLMAGIGILFVILSIWVLTSKRKGKINAANVYNRSFQYIQGKLSSGSKN